MPPRKIIQIQLPPIQPDRCVDCPLLGIIPKDYPRPKNSKETMICIGTMEAMSKRGARLRVSKRDIHHPLKHYCDSRWDAWMKLPGRQLGISTQAYNDYRVPYEPHVQLKIKFHNKK